MQWLAGCGLVSVMVLGAVAVQTTESQREEFPTSEAAPKPAVVRFLAVGDVNLGRTVGREILGGDTLYPFAAVRDSLAAYDLVFANLESPLSDQNGRTEDPRNNLIFTGPPVAAQSLKRGGIGIVSTANNHALDYGVKGLRQTLRLLDEAGVCHAGAAADSSLLYAPKLVVYNGIKIAFLACTDVMNIEDNMWKRYVAEADTTRLLPVIRSLRDSGDFIVVSYHGGEEYAARPTLRTRQFARDVIAGGADLFLGHHPHIPYGIEEFEGKYIIHSLGNFVFRQPDRYWTQRSFAFAANITRDDSGTRIDSFRCIPVHAGFQPTFTTDREEASTILERIKALSAQSLANR